MDVDVVVKAGRSLTEGHLHECVRPPRNDHSRLVDLAGVIASDPAGITLVASAIADAIDRDLEVRFRAPTRSRHGAYLSRMGLYEMLTDLGVDHDLPVVHPDGWERHVMFALRGIGSPAGLSRLSEQVANTYAHLHPEEHETLLVAVQELGQNVLDHSRPGEHGHGFIAIDQHWSTSSSDLRLAISDPGVGLRASLSAAQRIRDDEHAIARALERGVSGTPVPIRGYGLAHVARLTGRRAGAVTIWSGAAHGSVVKGASAPVINALEVPVVGTTVVARIVTTSKVRRGGGDNLDSRDAPAQRRT